ncbi:MAG TPA: hypothetical protein PLX89_09045 [Verrucomicrobiota bacterium]|nr:hypothetical protein [Verrucomicrobiota bacterium]
MNTQRRPDPLLRTLRAESTIRADRLHFATGELLGADDLSAEQTYHRRQLARALLLLHGSGTIAGLRVEVKPELNSAGTSLGEIELIVSPGLAIDRAGRLIEVVRPHCLRLRRWYEHLAAAAPDHTPEDEDDRTDLMAAFHPALGQVVADVFLVFHECDRAPSPAFATGPFDALDASQPSRTRDAHELKLVLRKEPDARLSGTGEAARAFDPWQELLTDAARTAPRPVPAEWSPSQLERWRRLRADAGDGSLVNVLRAASLSGWDSLDLPAEPALAEVHEYPLRFDPSAVLLARVRIPAAQSASGQVPTPDFSVATWQTDAVKPDNFVRNFILPPALTQRLGVAF